MHSVTHHILRNDSAKHYFGVWGPRVGPVTPKFELGRDFCTVHLATMFHHPIINHSEVILLTNNHTLKQTIGWH